MSESRIITDDDDRLPNVHPGDILRHDFLIGSEISVAEVARGAGIDSARLERLLDGAIPVDADINLRLARYFGMSEGFFLGLQQDYDVEEFKRAHGAELDRIAPRAAWRSAARNVGFRLALSGCSLKSFDSSRHPECA